MANVPDATTFRRDQWQAFFDQIDPHVRSHASAALCEAAGKAAYIPDALVNEACAAIRFGHQNADLIAVVEQSVADADMRYDAPIDGQSWHVDPEREGETAASFRQARAASAILDALHERYADMIYEASHVFDSTEQATEIFLNAVTNLSLPTVSASDSPLLPGGVFGRLASVIIGLFFSAVGGTVSTVLLHRPFERRLLVYYELALAGFAFGVLLLLWGLFAPRWVRSVIQFVTMHFMLALCVIFLPLAFEFLLLVIDEIF